MVSNTVGLFSNPDSALEAARRLKDNGLDRLEILSPIPLHGVEEVLGPKKSVIRRFTLFGGIFGGLAGFGMAAGTAVMYLHPTGGRPIITFPPFLIISYEMTILCGILFTVLGFLISARFPALRRRVYVPETAVNKFGVTVTVEGENLLDQAETILREAGAGEVRRVGEDDS